MINCKDYSVIIMSCDSYSDIWQPLTKSLEMFWSDCPFDIYLCSEEKGFKHAWIKNIKVGEKAGWGEMLLHVLDKIDTPNVIYLQEDYLLKGKTNNQELDHLLGIFEKLEAAYLRLLPWPGPDSIHAEYPEVGVCLPESKYRTSLQAAVWDKEILKEVTERSDDGRFESWSIKRAEKINKKFRFLRISFFCAMILLVRISENDF